MNAVSGEPSSGWTTGRATSSGSRTARGAGERVLLRDSRPSPRTCVIEVAATVQVPDISDAYLASGSDSPA